jgi:hypothetical protein
VIAGGLIVTETWFVPRGTVVAVAGRACIHPSDLMRMRNRGRTPLWSGRTLGERELQRDRRRVR